MGVGPLIAKALADHGATVVHVESAIRPDVLRLGPPFKDGIAGLDRSQFQANFNSSKMSLALNLAMAEGQEVARRLIAWSDVVLESFVPGVLRDFGFTYEALAKDRPELIMLSTCLNGQTGPYATYRGFGTQGSTLSGLHGLTGWPDRPPKGTWGAYTDFIAPRYGVATLTAAILERTRSGLGQYIDLGQVEAAIHFLEKCQNLPERNQEPYVSQSRQDRGGFIYHPGRSMAGGETNATTGKVALRSYGSISYAGLLSYVYADLKKEDPRVTAVLDCVRDNLADLDRFRSSALASRRTRSAINCTNSLARK